MRILNRYGSLAVLMLAMPALASSADIPCEPERWQTAIDKFVAADRESPPAENGVLFVGSSSIRLWDLEKSFPTLAAINRGFGGSQICDSTHFAEHLIVKHRPRIVILYAGDNDIAKGKSAAQVQRDFTDFCKRVHSQLPSTKIMFIAIKPSIKRWGLADTMRDANDRIAADCEANPLLEFVDVWQPMLGDDGKPRPELFVKDGLHLNEAGYELWMALVQPHLN